MKDSFAPIISSYSDTSITVSWPALVPAPTLPTLVPGNGDSDILSYDLRWDNGVPSNDPDDFELSNVLTTSYVVTGITAGTTYRFVVRARNVYGYASTYSDPISATAIDTPGKPTYPIVSAPVGLSTDVTITWSAPLAD